MRFLLIALLIILSNTNAHSDTPTYKKKSIKFSIQIKSARHLQDSLKIFFWKDYIYESKFDDAVMLKIPIERDNNLNFNLQGGDHVGRICILNHDIGEILSYNIVEPGDSIVIHIEDSSQDNFNISFSGRGCEKFNYVHDLKLFLARTREYIDGWDKIANKKNPNRTIELSDSLTNLYLDRLSQYKNITHQTRTLLKLDLIGATGNILLSFLMSEYIQADSESKPMFREALSKIFMNTEAKQDHIVRFSKNYIEYLYEKSRLKLIYQSNSKLINTDLRHARNFKFSDLYFDLRKTYTGMLREQLLAYCTNNFWTIDLFFDGCDADIFTDCLKDATNLITDDYLKNSIRKQLSTIGKGAIAYDFSLPDTNGKVVNLHDYKGKIILIDIWANPCGGCKVFKKQFDLKVYPEIKNSNDVVVISINMNKEKTKWISGLSDYSSPNFVNVYTDGQGERHPLVTHYNITGIPKLLLVDREGKIISATMPVASNGSEELLKLLQGALSQ